MGTVRHMPRQANPALTERESYVLKSRNAGVTLAAIGKELGVCVERVRQIEGKAARKAARFAQASSMSWGGDAKPDYKRQAE